ncbi:SDR family oxidoreductase, partial [Salmonella enterica]|uniref:SDR family oxidoreductase n=1 Tax=Salmonella enterica TaxID=28901 RepID=UPI003CF72657
LTEGLRAEAPDGVRTTIISPGAVDSELKTHSSDKETSEALLAWYEANQIPADSVARAIAYAIEQPANVDISEVVLRPVAQEFEVFHSRFQPVRSDGTAGQPCPAVPFFVGLSCC